MVVSAAQTCSWRRVRSEVRENAAQKALARSVFVFRRSTLSKPAERPAG